MPVAECYRCTFDSYGSVCIIKMVTELAKHGEGNLSLVWGIPW